MNFKTLNKDIDGIIVKLSTFNNSFNDVGKIITEQFLNIGNSIKK